MVLRQEVIELVKIPVELGLVIVYLVLIAIAVLVIDLLLPNHDVPSKVVNMLDGLLAEQSKEYALPGMAATAVVVNIVGSELSAQ